MAANSIDGVLFSTRLLLFPLAAVVLLATIGASAQVPHLTVVITAEQFRADYIPRYESEFSRNGLRRLIEHGAYFERCRYDHATNLAAPNAATLATGTYPSTHGITGNR